VLRALAAITVLLAIVAGTPVVLLMATGSPLPDHVPRITEVTGILSRPEDGVLLLGALKLLAWVAWAAFVSAVLLEVAARLRGRPAVPRLWGLGGIQRVAASLVASISLATASPAGAMLAGPPPPVSVEAPPHPLLQSAAESSIVQPLARNATPTGGDGPIYRVKSGDSLSRIAERQLGSSQRWPRIWRLNAFRKQPDGRVFTDPDHVHPGWRLRLPQHHHDPHRPPTAPADQQPAGPTGSTGTTASQTPAAAQPGSATAPPTSAAAPPIQHSRRNSIPRPVVRTLHEAIITIELPSGTLVALSFAAGISASLAATRLHRRRQRLPPPVSAGVSIIPEPVPEPAVQTLNRAHLRTGFTDHDEPPASNADLVRVAFSIDVPHDVVIGVQEDGTPCEVGLAGLSLALTGPGAHDAARAMALGLLTQADHHRAKLILPAQDATTLLGEVVEEIANAPEELPGLTTTPSLEAAIDMVEYMRLTRARMLADSEVDDVHELLRRDPGEVIPAVLLVVVVAEELDTRLQALLNDAARYGIGTLLLGPQAADSTCHVEHDGHVSAAAGTLAPQLRESRLFLVASSDAPSLLRVLATGHQVIPEEPRDAELSPEPPPPPCLNPEQEQPIRLLILGVPLVEVGCQTIPLSRRSKSLELLVYLALHPDGATKDEICACLWPDSEPGDRFHSTLRHLRDPLRESTGLRKALFVQADGDRYRIDPQVFNIDLWDFQRALAVTRTASDNPQRIAALEQAVTLIRGDLAHGAAYDWIDEQRYPLTRAQCDALAHLAELTEPCDPERALAALEQARVLDPDNEEIYLRVIRLQLRLERPDAARRTGRLLRARLDELGVEPRPETHEVLASLHGPRRASGRPARR
jgi:DNA-binding SARP family transcriptional activator